MVVGIIIAVLGTVAVGEGVLLAHMASNNRKAEAEWAAREEEADSEALQAASRAGADGATAALAPALAEIGAQLEVIRAQPDYCRADSGVYNESACLVDRCMAHAAVETDGAAKVCDELANLTVSVAGLAIIEGPPPGQSQGTPSADDMSRRKTWLRERK